MPGKTVRNVDKIRRLEADVTAERERRRNADLEVVRMHKMVDQARADAALQLAEISTATDGLLIALAQRHGAEVGPETWELSLEVYSPTELCKRYAASADRVGERYVIRVERRR